MPRINGTAGKPNPVDVHVGGRIRVRRMMRGMSQQKLGEAIGLTFQQVQKYERGTNRIGASRMLQIATALDVPVSYFYEEIDGKRAMAPAPDGELVKRETLELVRAYYRITDTKVRKRLFEMTKALGAVA